MSEQIAVTDKEVHLPNLHPNKAKLNEYGKKAETVRDKIAEVTKQFKPEAELKLSTATRFGAKPAHANTFLNHYAGPNTPGYQSEAERFRTNNRAERTLQMKCDFQHEEKAKKDAIHASKLNEKRTNMDRLTSKISLMDQSAMMKDTHNVLMRASA